MSYAPYKLKSQIIESLGESYSKSDDFLIEQLENYYTIYKETWKDLKEGKLYRLPVADLTPGIASPDNARHRLNISFGVMNECAAHIRKILDLLGLTKKNQKIDLTTNEVQSKTLLDDIKSKYKK